MIESLLAALAIGTVWFWIIALVASILIIACVENEHYPTPSIVAILLAIIYWKPITAAPWQTIGIVVGGFVLAGILWSVFSWFRLVQKKTNYYREKYGDTLTAEQMSDLKESIKVSSHKARITGWIAFWPWSLFWTLTGDFFNMIYDAMVNVYQNITNRALGKFSVKPKEIITDADAGHNNARRRQQY